MLTPIIYDAEWWRMCKEYLGPRASHRPTFDEMFEHKIKNKADRMAIREQLIAECCGWADPV